MAQGFDVLGDIMKVLQFHEQRKSRKVVEKLQAEEFKQRKLEFQEEQKREKERIGHEKERIGLQEKQVNLQSEAARLLQQKDILDQKTELQKKATTGVLGSTPGVTYEAEGEAPSGAQYSPRFGDIDPNTRFVRYNVPKPGGMEGERETFGAPSPTAFAKFQAGIADITNASTRAYELQKQKEENEANYAQARMQEVMKTIAESKKLQEEHEKHGKEIEGRMAVRKEASRSAAEVARIRNQRQSANTRLVEQDLEPFIKDIEKGNITNTEFNQIEGLVPEQKGVIHRELNKRGIKFWNTDQKKLIGLSGSLIEMFQHMDKIIEIQSGEGTGFGVIGGATRALSHINDSRMKAAEDMQEFLTTPSGRFFATQVGNTSASDEDRVRKAHTSRWSNITSNVVKRNTFYDRYVNTIENHMKGLSEAQKREALKEFGLDKIKHLTLDAKGNVSGLTTRPDKPISSPSRQQNQSQQQLLRQTPIQESVQAPGGSPLGQQVPGQQGLPQQELQQSRQNDFAFNPNKRYRIVSTTGESGVFQGNDPVLQRLYRNLRGLNRLGAISEEGGK